MSKPIERIDVSGTALDRLRKLVAVEHEHYEGQNECSICDTPILDAASETIEHLTAEVASLREQLAAREATIDKLASYIGQYTAGVAPVFSEVNDFLLNIQDENKVIREHEVRLLEEMADAVYCKFDLYYIRDWIKQEAATRRNQK